MSAPKIVGLTGGIGAGKSVVASIFSHLGIPVYNADNEAKQLYHQPLIKSKMIALFGSQAYENGQINRAYLSDKIFNDKKQLATLNQLIHPAVAKHFSDWCNQLETPYVIKEAAILFESGSNKNCDFVISVSAPEELRIDRVMKRDETNRMVIQARMDNQWLQAKKDELANLVILNDGSQSLIKQVTAAKTQLDLL